jgi:hypothetical protein
MGCRTQYRAFSKNDVLEITLDPAHNPEVRSTVEYMPVNTKVQWFPNRKEGDGLFVLCAYPADDILPTGFIAGSRDALVDTVKKFKTIFPTNTRGCAEWDEFLLRAPASDNVADYVSVNPLIVPMIDQQFKGINISTQYTVNSITPNPRNTFAGKEIQQVEATASVRWGNRHEPLPHVHPRVLAGTDIPALLDLVDPASITVDWLREILSSRGLPRTGNRDVLLER